MPRALPLPPSPLTDGKIMLGPWRDEDVPQLLATLEDPEIAHWTFIPSPYRARDAREFLAKQRRDRDSGIGIALAIRAADSRGGLLGGVGIEPMDRAAGRGEIGYWVAREQRRRGVATRAVRLLAEWALSDLGLRRLEILPFAGNVASERVAEAAGFSLERRLRAHRLHPQTGEVRDMSLYARTRPTRPRAGRGPG